MTNQKLITVCIATYNRSKTVARLVQELLDFELNDQIEILVIDNDSPDNTFEELSKFSHHNNVSIFKNEKNIGFARSLLRCFNLCKTEYLIQLPDDEILYRDGIPELLSLLPTLDVDFLAPRWTRPSGLPLAGRGSDKVKEISLTYLLEQGSHSPGCVFRASILRFSEKYILERLDKDCALAFFYPQNIVLYMAKLNNLKLYSCPIILGGYRPEGALPSSVVDLGGNSYGSLSVSYNNYLGMKHFYEDMLIKFYDSPLVDELKVISDAYNLNLYNIIDDAVCSSDDSELKSLGENLRVGSIKNIFNPIKGFRYLVRFFIVKLKALRYR
jgi:glycosyltransferase involved in cell wall biosynthesis